MSVVPRVVRTTRRQFKSVFRQLHERSGIVVVGERSCVSPSVQFTNSGCVDVASMGGSALFAAKNSMRVT